MDFPAINMKAESGPKGVPTLFPAGPGIDIEQVFGLIIHHFQNVGMTADELLVMAAALEKKSEHPLAKAVMAYTDEKSISAAEVTDFMAMPGNGLRGSLEGKALYGGNLSFISGKSAVPRDMKTKAEKLAQEYRGFISGKCDGKLNCILLLNGTPIGA